MIQRRGQTIEVGCLIRFKDKRKGKPNINQGRVKHLSRSRHGGKRVCGVTMEDNYLVLLHEVVERVCE